MEGQQNDSTHELNPHDEESVKRIADKLENAAKSPEKNNLHIIARGDFWIIKREGAQKAYRIFDSKSKAIDDAKEMIQNGSALHIIIHQQDGNVARRI